MGYFSKQSFTKVVTLEKDKVGGRVGGRVGGWAGGPVHQGSVALAAGLLVLADVHGWHVHLYCPAPYCPVPHLHCLQWFGFIKDYDGGTLMECRIHPTLPYASFPGGAQ